MRSALAIVLAAGEGTRMRSALPKVLHPVGHLPMLGHVLKAVTKAGCERAAVVIGPDHDAVAELVRTLSPAATTHVQSERLGTAHAVLAARQALEETADDIIVVFGDTPFVSVETFARLREGLAESAAIVVAGTRPADPAGYGRLIMEGDRLVAIREERDATPEERAIGFCNGGIMALAGEQALSLLDAIGNDNAKGEYYLTDAVAEANRRGLTVQAVEIPAAEVFGVNTRAHLAEAEAMFQTRRRATALEAGVTLRAPETVFFAHDTDVAADVTIEPNVVFGPGVTIASGATIRAFSHVEGASVAEGAIVGPFARLRPGAEIGARVHIGNFVEVKQATIGEGAKVNHLSYVGDASVGARSNIGAGTITCNYDGTFKHRTEIGSDVFIGTNTLLVAPVSVGDGAYTATGSVITDDVEPDALAIARARQSQKPGWAKARREKAAAEKAAAEKSKKA